MTYEINITRRSLKKSETSERIEVGLFYNEIFCLICPEIGFYCLALNEETLKFLDNLKNF